MSTLKVVADYVPESCDYLIAGKVYEMQMLGEGHRGGDIIDEDGYPLFISIGRCAHLCGGSWRIVE